MVSPFFIEIIWRLSDKYSAASLPIPFCPVDRSTERQNKQPAESCGGGPAASAGGHGERQGVSAVSKGITCPALQSRHPHDPPDSLAVFDGQAALHAPGSCRLYQTVYSAPGR